jgi:Mg2+-importing ATPase
MTTDSYWAQPEPELLAQLDATASGLTQAEAESRLRRFGENRIGSREGPAAWRLLLRQYESPLVLILVFGALISALVREWADAAIILVIVAASTALGFVQEYRASEAVRRLRETLALKVSALRDGTLRTIEVREVVPGDIVLLSAGNLIPADGVLLEARDFLVTQSALTGESFPVEKTPGCVAEGATLQQRVNCVFLGTSVRSGTARMLVTRTGTRTEFGEIAGRLAETPTDSDFQRGIRHFGYLLTRVMTVIVIFVFTMNLLFHRPLVESLLFAVALAVGLTPELLPAIVSVTLSAGARRMATDGVIVRRLEAIEDLGSLDILCTDKTGTLTKGVVELSGATGGDGSSSDRVFMLAALNSRLETGIDNPLDAAIVAAAEKRALPQASVRKIDEIPYDFQRKRLTIVVAEKDRGDSHLLVTKGAFDNVIACCDRLTTGGGDKPLDDAARATLNDFYEKQGAQGFRVLGVATKRSPVKTHYDRNDESGMTFEGFLLFFDPLKDDIEATVRDFGRLGIAVKVITGDNRHVAAHIADAVGLDPARLLTGAEMTALSQEALCHLAEQTDVFAEIDPQQKERIVRALQHRGHSVAFLGDGINDAPALHAADVGISVDQAVDVARETADVVLTRRDLGVLKNGILDGRRTFANTLKYVAIATSANFGNMISMAAATLFLPFLPLVAKQILLNNFLSDFPSVSISTDNVDAGMLDHAQHWDIRNIQWFMVVFGLISTAFDFLTFAVLIQVFHTPQQTFQTAWFVVSVLTELAVVLVLRTRLRSWRSRPSRLLVLSIIAVAIIALSLPYLGPLSRAFGFVPLPATILIVMVAIVAGYVIATEAAKPWFYARIAAPRRTATIEQAVLGGTGATHD